jgi:hypothetical protein
MVWFVPREAPFCALEPDVEDGPSESVGACVSPVERDHIERLEFTPNFGHICVKADPLLLGRRSDRLLGIPSHFELTGGTVEGSFCWDTPYDPVPGKAPSFAVT